MAITQEQLNKLIPKAKGGVQPWVEALNTTLPTFEINTTNRIAAFIAQCAHESGGFSVLEENLNYKATTLTRLWPQRFPVSVVDQYAGRPQAIPIRHTVVGWVMVTKRLGTDSNTVAVV